MSQSKAKALGGAAAPEAGKDKKKDQGGQEVNEEQEKTTFHLPDALASVPEVQEVICPIPPFPSCREARWRGGGGEEGEGRERGREWKRTDW